MNWVGLWTNVPICTGLRYGSVIHGWAMSQTAKMCFMYLIFMMPAILLSSVASQSGMDMNVMAWLVFIYLNGLVFRGMLVLNIWIAFSYLGWWQVVDLFSPWEVSNDRIWVGSSWNFPVAAARSFTASLILLHPFDFHEILVLGSCGRSAVWMGCSVEIGWTSQDLVSKRLCSLSRKMILVGCDSNWHCYIYSTTFSASKFSFCCLSS